MRNVRKTNSRLGMFIASAIAIAGLGLIFSQSRFMHHPFSDTSKRPAMTGDALFGDHEDDGHGDHDKYNDETIRRAITQGIDAGGKPLDQAMPKWSMLAKDLDDLVNFLKSE